MFNQGYHRPIPLDRFLHAEGTLDPRLLLVRTLALDGDDLVGAVTL
ncbi:hypothetical protein [Deinococcus apachensis]|nr:hypothetical protein [Deinococcus apachensis]